jgi:hypothetical protein
VRGTLEKRFTVARLLIVFWYMKGKPQYILFCCVSGPCTIKTISLLKDENLGSIQKSCLYMISWTLHENIWTLFNFYLSFFFEHAGILNKHFNFCSCSTVAWWRIVQLVRTAPLQAIAEWERPTGKKHAGWRLHVILEKRVRHPNDRLIHCS